MMLGIDVTARLRQGGESPPLALLTDRYIVATSKKYVHVLMDEHTVN
jgi:hypothetical protein